jgi:hypothetical protein
MRIRIARCIASRWVGLVTGVGCLVVCLVPTPVKAQSSAAVPVGACCVDLDDAVAATEGQCSGLGEYTSWTITSPVDAHCGACIHTTEMTCRYAVKEDCIGSMERFCPDATCAACLEAETGSCCEGTDACTSLSRAECTDLGGGATWVEKRHCADIECGACARSDDKTCRYVPQDMCTLVGELFCSGASCAKCLENFDPPPDSACMMHRVFELDSTILGNMGVFHRFQDEIVVESVKGREMKALFHEHMHELGLVLLRHPDLLVRGRELLLDAAPGFRDLLDEPGGEPLRLTPELVQRIDQFLADVADHAGSEARGALDQVRAEFEAVKGMTLREIRALHQPDRGESD